jgi:putative Mg2+ transporter-C (MgtC) family protein
MHGEQFIDSNIVMFGKLALAMLLGGIIGTERAVVARQVAGTRTFGIVAMGACLFILAGNYVDSAYLGIVNFNPSYVAAAVVTGIGFLGGGLIVFRGDGLHGVTTAAGLWITAAIGVATGFGMYNVAIFASLLTLVMFTGVWYVENRFKHWFESETPENAKLDGLRRDQ